MWISYVAGVQSRQDGARGELARLPWERPCRWCDPIARVGGYVKNDQRPDKHECNSRALPTVLQRERRCTHQERDHCNERCCDSQPRSAIHRHPTNSVAAEEAAEIEQHGNDSNRGADSVERTEPHQDCERTRPLHFRKNKTDSNAKIGNSTGPANLKMKPKKLGVGTFKSCAIALTRRFGPFPM